MKKGIKIGAGVIVGLLLVWGLVSLGGSSDIQSLSEQAEQQRAAAPKVEAPNFTLDSLDGPPITLADYKGVKPVILDFWATWCPNCRRDMPVLSDLYVKNEGAVEVIAVNLQESETLVSNFVNNFNLKFPVVFDRDGSIARKYGITYTSTKVFIDIDGIIQDTFPADIKDEDFQKLLETEAEPITPEPPQAT